MSVYKEINDRVTSAADEAREIEKTHGKEAAKNAFFSNMVDLYNDTIAGDVTLVNGDNVTIPKIVQL